MGNLWAPFVSNRVYRDYDELFDKATDAWKQLTEDRLQSLTATA